MKNTVVISLLFFVLSNGCLTSHVIAQKTVINPLNLSYRFRPETNELSRREAADPTMVVFKNEYFLFASKTGGYWYSSTLADWKLIETDQLPSEDYAPTAVVIGDAIYFMASNNTKCPIYKSTDPKSGKWELVCSTFPYAVTDPALFLDDDKRLYFYWGCSNKDPIMGVELDVANSFMPIGKPDSLIFANAAQYGWENPGDNNELIQQAPWIEGAWMTKHNGIYYLHYASPGTEFKSYADAVYVSDSPLSKFHLAENNPMAYKPAGFIDGIGHGSVFKDNYGNYWHIGTMSISVRHPFERRLGLHPVFFDTDNVMHSYTAFGDYPFVLPDKKVMSEADCKTPWMLLSYNKPVKASSQLADHPAGNAVNEDVRTYWSAKTGKKGEWLMVNLNVKCQVNAVQVNFAEQDVNLFGRQKNCSYKYLLEYSTDGKKWKTLSDKSTNILDTPHDYIQLAKPVTAFFIRITNLAIPDGKFAISGLRVFGKGEGNIPQKVTELKATRQPDKRIVDLKWKSVDNAVGYNINFGSKPDKLYLNYMVYGANTQTIRSLNTNSDYYFRIEAFNENGISEKLEIVHIE